MGFKGILLDIDNTLYNYDICHQKAFTSVLTFAKTELKIDNFEAAYAESRKSIHSDLAGTAASHNRLLYFQRACEILGLNPLFWALNLYQTYWDVFLTSIQVFDGVYDFLETSSKKSTLCLVTDLTAHIQYRKIKKLGMEKYVSYIVTSEEAGHEKPHPAIFKLALKKMGMSFTDVCMIGDDYEKDIFGAMNLEIRSFWLNRDHEKIEPNELITEFQTFSQIITKV